MREIILRWLFGTSYIKEYMDLLEDARTYLSHYSKSLEEHRETIEQFNEALNREERLVVVIKKLLKICEKHGIDVDKELEQIEL